MKRNVVCSLFAAIILASVAARPGLGKTFAIPLPGLLGRYYDADRMPGVDGRLLRYQQETSIDWLGKFESIDDVQISISGKITPSKWQLLAPQDRVIPFPFTNSSPIVTLGELANPLDSPTPTNGVADQQEPAVIDEWTELSGLEFFLHAGDDWTRGLTASISGSRTAADSVGVVDFSYKLSFQKFFVPELGGMARTSNSIELSREGRVWLDDLISQPIQTSIGIIDVTDVRLIVDGVLLPNATIPEPSTLTLLGTSLLAVGCIAAKAAVPRKIASENCD